MPTAKRTSRARKAILEILSDGRWRTVRDLKRELKAGYGVDMEATAQRIYELRLAKHGAHNIPCTRRRGPDGRLKHGYRLVAGCATLSRNDLARAMLPGEAANIHDGDTEHTENDRAEGRRRKDEDSAVFRLHRSAFSLCRSGGVRPTPAEEIAESFRPWVDERLAAGDEEAVTRAGLDPEWYRQASRAAAE